MTERPPRPPVNPALPVRVLVQRAVSEEETINIEAHVASYPEAEKIARDFSKMANDLRRDYNRRVHRATVQGYRAQLALLERKIAEKSQALARLGEGTATVEHAGMNGEAWGD